MTRASRLVVMLLAGLLPAAGCSVILAPDRAEINRDAAAADGGFDSGMDGGMDGDIDGGFDGGPDGGDPRCLNAPAFEVSCTNAVDDDCDGLEDCEDFDCAGAITCCMQSNSTTVPYADNGLWQDLGGPTRGSAGINFGGGRSAALLTACSPLAFGASYRATMQAGVGPSTDFASLVMGPVNAFGPSGLLTEIAVILQDGEFRVERAGSPIGDTLEIGAVPYTVQLNVFPGADEAGRAVLRAQVDVARMGAETTTLLDDVAVMPLDDLIDCGAADGLYVGFEGQGTSVRVTGEELATEIFACGNPSQLREDRFYERADTFGDVGPGGLGEPALSAFAVTTATAGRLELWLDAASTERSDEIILPPAYAIHGAYVDSTLSWTARDATTAGREPSIASVTDAARIQTTSDLFVAYVDETGDAPTIAISTVRLPSDSGLASPHIVDRAPCTGGVRDPALAHLSGTNPSEFLLLYTCQRPGLPDTIGALLLRYDLSGGTFSQVGMANDDLIVGSDARDRGGVFSPEIIVHARATAGEFAVPLWYLARAEGGRVSLHFASGVLEAESTLPRFEVYAGNPILDADDSVLGSSSDCEGGCRLQSLAVADTYSSLFWDPASTYLLLINRTRFDVSTGDPIHELLPVSQPRPANP